MLRRELKRIALVTARPDDDPKHVQRTAAGWEMLQSYLQVHHTTEDDMLWPPMRKARALDHTCPTPPAPPSCARSDWRLPGVQTCAVLRPSSRCWSRALDLLDFGVARR